MDPEEFRSLGHRLIDWIADYRLRERDAGVYPTVEPGEVRSRLPAEPPEQPRDLLEAFAELEPLLNAGTLKWQHPRFFGYFPSNADLASVLGDLVSSGTGQLGLNWEASPALTELEEHVLGWMRDLFGLPGEFRGVIQDTASTSTLIALLCAREVASGHAQERGGLQGLQSPLVVYCSEQSHSSVTKAALLAGFGRENVRPVPTDAGFAMDPERLAAAVRADVAAGRTPAAVVASFGTTATLALDPLEAIAAIAAEHGAWLHVDGAMAGAALLLPECRPLAAGIGSADSIVINAHKWIGAVFDCSLFFTRRPEHLVRLMSTSPSYLRTEADHRTTQFRDWGIALGRRFRALKLWFLLNAEGVEGIRARLRRDIANAGWLAERVSAEPGWELVAPAGLQTVVVRHVPAGMGPDDVDAHTLAWARRINRSGKAYLTPTQLHGRWAVRVSVGALPTEREDVEALWRLMREEATVPAAGG